MGKNPALLYVSLHTFGETSFNFIFRTHFFNSKCLIWAWHLCDFWLCGRFCFYVHNSNALFQLIIAQSRVLPYSCLQQSLLGSSKHHHLTRPFIFKMLTCTVIGYKWMSVPSEWLKEKRNFSGRWPTNFICQPDLRPLQAAWLKLWLVHHWHNPSITGSWLKHLMDRNKRKNINMALVNYCIKWYKDFLQVLRQFF